MSPGRGWWWLLAAGAVLLAAGTVRAADPSAPASKAPLLVVGLDGAEWDVVLPMLADGELPTLAGLMKRGTYGLLDTLEPTLSPAIWTTIATGKTPAEHGITDFVRHKSDGTLELLTNSDRKVKALWNIASDYDKRVCVIGWWMTWPVEPIHGVMVAQTNTLSPEASGQRIWKGTLVADMPAQVFPPDRQQELLSVLDEVRHEMEHLSRDIFGRFTRPLGDLDYRRLRKTEWALRADAIYRRVGLKLLAARPAYDLTLIYFGGPDVVGHRFWRFMRPEGYPEPPSTDETINFARMIPDYYKYMDRVLGELLAAAPDGTRVIVLSDHGMHAVYNKDPRFSAHHRDAPPGLFIAAGPGFRRMGGGLDLAKLRRSDLQTIGSVYDIAPTILVGMGIPVGRDMCGHVLRSIFSGELDTKKPPLSIESHDTPEFLTHRPVRPGSRPGLIERLQQLRSLGYVGDAPEEPEPSSQPTSRP